MLYPYLIENESEYLMYYTEPETEELNRPYSTRLVRPLKVMIYQSKTAKIQYKWMI